MQKTIIAKYVFIALTVLVVCLLTLTLIVRFYKDSNGATLLDHAIENNSLIQVKCLVALGADVKYDFGFTALHDAAYNGSLEIVQWLAEHGLDVKAKDDDGCTALYFACINGNPELVKWLVEQGVDVNAKNAYGKTALHEAAWRKGRLELVQYLVERGAEVNIADCEFPVLHNAASAGDLEVVQWLVEHGADINAKDMWGRTVLHSAAYGDSVELIQWLVEQGLDINATDNAGETPLDKVCRRNNAVTQWLREHGAKESKQ